MLQPNKRREKSGSSRTPARLSTRLDKGLLAYIAAASAAGVGTLAGAPPADAEIVYTPANAIIRGGTDTYNLDLNHDGITDFKFTLFQNCIDSCYSQLDVYPANGPNVVVAGGGPSSSAPALLAGVKVGPSGPFNVFGLMASLETFGGTFPAWRGQWVNGGKGVKDRYLGFRFAISGQFHYGWARLTVTTTKTSFTPILTGYAYETVPDQPITTGVFLTPSPSMTVPNNVPMGSVSSTKENSAALTLGALARGAP